MSWYNPVDWYKRATGGSNPGPGGGGGGGGWGGSSTAASDNALYGVMSGTNTGDAALNNKLTPGSSPAAVQDNYDPYGGYYSGGGGGGGGGGAYGATAPSEDLTPYRNSVLDKIRGIQSVYDSLSGDVNRIAQERTGQLTQNYDNQFNNLNTAYGNNQNAQSNAYGARGLGSSSYYTDAQKQSQDIYNQNTQDILGAKNNDLASIGQFAASNKGQFSAAKNGYNDYINNIMNYDKSGLMSLQQQLGGAQSQVDAQRAGFGTQSDFINKLNGITPVINKGAETLAQNLQKLTTASAPQFAKDQIAQGLIKQAQLQDPNAQNYWQNYYQQLLSGGR